MESPGEWQERLAAHMGTGRKVGLTGAGGAGKTTFASYLAESFGGFLHSEGARTWLEQQEIDRYWTMSPSQVGEMQQYLLRRLEASDASIYDRITSDTFHFAQRASDHLDLCDFEDRCRIWLDRIDCIVYFPYYAEFLRKDGVRNTDDRYQLAIASGIFDWLIANGLEGKVLVYRHCDSPDDNARRIAEFLDAARSDPVLA
jgi:AAA domain-containing protein